MHDDFYQMYLEELRDIPQCTEKERTSLLKEAAAGKAEAKRRLIEGSLQTALDLAKEYDGKGVLLTDLVQEANMAFIMAVDEFLSGGEERAFDPFAACRMREALERAVEEQHSADETGEELAARVNVLQMVSQALAKELGREATVEELAKKMKMGTDEVREIMKMAMDAMSMNAENMSLEDLSGVEGIEITEAVEEREE